MQIVLFVWIFYTFLVESWSTDEWECKRSLYPFNCIQISTTCGTMQEYTRKYRRLRAKGKILQVHASETPLFLNYLVHWTNLAIALDVAIVINTNDSRDMLLMLEPNLLQYEYDIDVKFFIDSASFDSSASNKTHVLHPLDESGIATLLYPISLAGSMDVELQSITKYKIEPNVEYGELQLIRNHSDFCIFNYFFRWTSYAFNLYEQLMVSTPQLMREYSVWYYHTPSSGEDRITRNLRKHNHAQKKDGRNFVEICHWYKSAYSGFNSRWNNQTNVIYLISNSEEFKSVCMREISDLQFVVGGLLSSGHKRHHKLDLSIPMSLFLELMILTRSVGVVATGGVLPLLPIRMRPTVSEVVKTSLPWEIWTYYFAKDRFISSGTQDQVEPTFDTLDGISNDILDITTIPLLPYDYSRNLSQSHNAGCGEALWCEEADMIQKRIFEWQNPSRETCQNSSFLIFEPFNYGIGSMIHIAASALSFAICQGRILYFPQNATMQHNLWRSSNCTGTSIECYFERITSCTLDEKDFDALPIVNNKGTHSNAQYVRLTKVPMGSCGLCGNYNGYPLVHDMYNKEIYTIENPLMSQHVRYVMRPLNSLRNEIKQFLELQPNSMKFIPKPFASMHVRYGDKHVEAPRVSLDTYIQILKIHYPTIRTVFLSTETSEVITNLTRDYPEYQFYSMVYDRIESKNVVKITRKSVKVSNPAMREFVASMANLLLSIQANAFVGSLTSNWCRLIHELERNRGDGGSEYYSVDGSQFGSCFEAKK